MSPLRTSNWNIPPDRPVGSAAADAQVQDRWRQQGFWSPTSLGDVVSAGLARTARTARVFKGENGNRTTTNGEIDRAGRRLATRLQQLGLQAGDVIAIQLPNSFENDVTLRAALLLGLTFLPIISIYGQKELNFILRQSGAKALLVPARFRGIDYRDRVNKLAELPQLQHVVMTGCRASPEVLAWDDLVESSPPMANPVDMPADSVCALVYTSGTTADPKGVQHTHNTLLAERGGAAKLLHPDPGLPAAPSLQLFPAGHIASALGTIFSFTRDSTTVCFDTFDPTTALDAIRRYRLTSTAGVPVFLNTICELIESSTGALSSLESCMVGGASVPPSLVERADRLGIKACRSYGSTEHPTVTGTAPTDDLQMRAYTDGYCLPGNQVRVIDENGRDASAGDTGEIAVLGPELFVGFKDAKANEGAFLPGGWYLTGDLGYLTDDALLTVTDRKKDIIIRGGENISAKEVEDLLTRHSAVAECAIIGASDARLGEQVCAFVVLRPQASLTLEDVRRHFAVAGCARQKTPERLIAVDELPRTPTGKVRKTELRARAGVEVLASPQLSPIVHEMPAGEP